MRIDLSLARESHSFDEIRLILDAQVRQSARLKLDRAMERNREPIAAACLFSDSIFVKTL